VATLLRYALVAFVSFANAADVPPKKNEECVRWTWTGDVYNRKVVCLEWRKKELNKERKQK